MSTDDRLSEAARLFNIPATVLLRRGRSWQTCRARNAVMWALRDAGWTTVAIAELFGRDHTTVLSNVAEAERRATRDPAYALTLAAMR